MEINTVTAALAAAAARDTETAAWCRATYGRGHTVYVNYDGRNRPGEAECPCVIIYPLAKSTGRGVETIECVYVVVVMVHDAARRTHPDGNLIEYTGVRNLETLRKKVEAALAAAAGVPLLYGLEVEYETIEAFPLMWSAQELRYLHSVVMSSDPLNQ